MKIAMLAVSVAALTLTGCASVTLKPVDFSWAFESVLTTDQAGVARGEPKTVVLDAKELFRAEEGKKSEAFSGRTVRIIRNDEGYYFVTSPGFAHVYIFESARGKLSLQKKVLIAKGGMQSAYFNRRDEGIQLVADGQIYTLNRKGVVRPGGKK